MIKFLLLFIIAFFSSSFVFSQLVTQGGIPPGQLVQNVLVGQGVTVSNVTYSGSVGAIGRFNASNTSLGMDEGIIMTTGVISDTPAGPHGPNDREDAGMNNNSGGFGLLTNLVGSQTFNAAILEFDFVPQSDTVKFEYIFASDEYPEFVNSQFNDVFAFFISGPGIAGTQNMAIIPGTTQPVAINNLNNGLGNNGPCVNCNFYVNNGTGNNPPFNQNSFYVQYDGFTTPLQAVSPVQCGETYHLIIAIADVADEFYDSGIFLAANSLSSLQPVNVSYTLTSDPYGDGKTLAQGCSSAIVTVTRSGDISQPLAVPITTSGSAVEGVDYSTVPSAVNFDAGQSEVSFTIDALPGGNIDETENLILSFQIFDPCDNEDFQEIELFINEVEDVQVEIISDDIFCPGDELTLIAQATGGGDGYNFIWNTGDTTSSITINPSETTVYSVTVTDNCLEQSATDEKEVEVPEFLEMVLTMPDDIETDCPFEERDLAAFVEGGANGYVYEWSADGVIIGNSATISVSPENSTTYTLVVTDQCGGEVSGEVTVTVLSPPLVLDITPDQDVCPGDSALIVVTATGGFGEYTYLWIHSGETTDSVIVSPEETTTYQVVVQDECRTFQRTAFSTVFVVEPEAFFQIVTNPIFAGWPITFQNLTNNGETYEWDFGDGNTSTMVHPNNTFNEPGDYLVTLIAEDALGCRDTITKLITIDEEYHIYIPNAITPDGNEFNEEFKVSTVNITQFQIQIFNRWGELLFESSDRNFSWDATYKGRRVRDGVYPWKVTYRSKNDDEDVILNGFVTVIR